MRISHRWLSEYVDLPPVEELAARLTAVGLEVEGVERRGSELAGIVAARIVASEKHPNAEKLSVTRVDTGSGEPLQVVCGAKNYRVGDLVPLATVGTTLPGGTRIERAKLRGVESFGMLCSARELGLEADASGLLILPADVQPGTPIAKALEIEDTLLEVNVTPNRPDALCHVGVAREVAAAFGRSLRMPAVRLAESGTPAAEAVRIRIDAPDKCHRYAARVVEGVRIGPSPNWLVRRLEACGVRSISNVVDVTNFVLLELGHPLHAFDLDLVAGQEIIVRTARPGERITTLDGKERSLDPDDLLIADRDRGSALAGVMGGAVSEINPQTSRVLIESAWFSPSGIRRTSRRHGLKTEASYRFERGADPGAVLTALDRCAAMIAELAGGAIRAGVVDANPRPFQASEVRLPWASPGRVLGVEVPREEIRQTLTRLGFTERASGPDDVTVLVPSWRQDVAIEEDLIEEIVRTRGYDAIAESLPRLAVDNPAVSLEGEVTSRVRAALEAAGFSEAVNFSFVAPAELSAFDPSQRPIALKNPISADLAVMRTSVLPSLFRNAAHNLRQHVNDVRLYEMARCYRAKPGPGDEPVEEPLEVGAVLLGRRSPVGWAAPRDGLDFFDAKAAVEEILSSLGVSSVRWEVRPAAWSHPRFSAAIVGPGGQNLGVLGELHPRVTTAFELPRGVFAFRLDFEALMSHARTVPSHGGIPRFPAVLRDLAVVVDERVQVAQLLAVAEAEPLVEEAMLFDVYVGAPIPVGKKNVALALRYRVADRTLTDAEVTGAHDRIMERLRQNPAIQAELRS